jgi:hypothetical protein
MTGLRARGGNGNYQEYKAEKD